MKTITRISALLTLLFLALVGPTPDRVNAAADIAAMIANAKTAADQEAIAAYYDKKAASAKEDAAVHRQMLVAIKSRSDPAIVKWHMDTHCEQLIQQYESAAQMYTDMAAVHREMAKDVK